MKYLKLTVEWQNIKEEIRRNLFLLINKKVSLKALES
jgi:hypothetical protein